jgi:hypothetical protein
MGFLGDDAQVEARFGMIGDSATLDATLVHGLLEHTVGSKIVLDTPDRTPGDMGHVESGFDLF